MVARRQIGERFIWHTFQPLLVTQLLNWKTWRRTLQTSRLHAAQKTPNTKTRADLTVAPKRGGWYHGKPDIKTAANVCLFCRISQLASSLVPTKPSPACSSHRSPQFYSSIWLRHHLKKTTLSIYHPNNPSWRWQASLIPRVKHDIH